MNRTKILISCLVALTIDHPAHLVSQSGAKSDSGQVNRALDDYVRSVNEVGPSTVRDARIAQKAAELRSLDQAAMSKTLIERAVNAPTGQDVAKYRDLIAQMAPTLKSDFFARAIAETNPVRKRKFIRISAALWGRDAARFLVSQLDDKRSAETFGDLAPRAVRICDVSLNVLNTKIGGELDVHIGIGGGIGGDAIVPDVPIEKRDQWIATFKNALIAKYGPDLNVPEKK